VLAADAPTRLLVRLDRRRCEACRGDRVGLAGLLLEVLRRSAGSGSRSGTRSPASMPPVSFTRSSVRTSAESVPAGRRRRRCPSQSATWVRAVHLHGVGRQHHVAARDLHGPVAVITLARGRTRCARRRS
jgi:hypothetical protein